MPTATSLPITWTATMVTASHWVGFTLPGIIELPGSFSGMNISPRPSLGPEASHLTSLAIFIMLAASPFIAPWQVTSASFEVSAWNLFSSVINGSSVSSAIFLATCLSKFLGAFIPVPTAVPPRASLYMPCIEAFICPRLLISINLQPLISWENLIGVASCR